MEEDVEDVSNGSAEVWDESLEAPFWDILRKWFWNVTKFYLCYLTLDRWIQKVVVSVHCSLYSLLQF